MEISIVLPSYEGAARVGQALEALEVARERSPAPVQVIVVDNGSRDATSDVVRRFPWARLLRLEQNQGFGGGVAAGVAEATGDVLGILSDDVAVEPGFFEPLVAHFERSDTFAVMPRILTPAGDRLDIAPALPEVRHAQLKLDLRWDAPAEARSADPLPVMFAAGGMALFHRERFLALGGFADIFLPGYHEDVDLCWRAWSRGWGSYYEPRSVVHHDHGQGAFTLNYKHLRLRTLMRRNWVLLNLINLERSVLAQLGWLALHTASRVLRRLLRPSKFVTHLMALPLILARLPEALRRRRRERAERVLANRELFAAIHTPWRPLLSNGSGPASEQTAP